MKRICYLSFASELKGNAERQLGDNVLIVTEEPPEVDYLKLEIRVLETNTEFTKSYDEKEEDEARLNKSWWNLLKGMLRRGNG